MKSLIKVVKMNCMLYQELISVEPNPSIIFNETNHHLLQFKFLSEVNRIYITEKVFFKYIESLNLILSIIKDNVNISF